MIYYSLLRYLVLGEIARFMMCYSNHFEQLVGPPIFIIGVARSGTTWLLDILDRHPLVTTVSESTVFSNVIPALMRKVADNQEYGLARIIDREQMRFEARRLVQSLFSHAIGPEHRYLAEKSPSHIFDLELIHEIFPEALLVHILRDGRDVAVSMRAAAKSWAPGWRSGFARNVITCARTWRWGIHNVTKHRVLFGDNFLEIRYEELRADPQQGYRRLFDFANIPYDEAILKAIFVGTDFEHNYTPAEGGFRRGGRTGDWRRQMNLVQALAFNVVAGDVLIKTGYEDNRFWLPEPFYKNS